MDSIIIENGTEMRVSQKVCNRLLKEEIIYSCDECGKDFYHISCGKGWDDVDKIILEIMSEKLEKIEQFVENTDWKQFAKEKAFMVEKGDELDGMVAFLDGLQDLFVDVLQFPEENIFTNLEE